MIKGYISDMVAVLMVTVMAVVLAGKPAMNPGKLQSPQSHIKVTPIENLKESKVIDRPIEEPDQAIKERNVFSASGTYAESSAQPLPDNPYTLIAVLQGNEKKAVFRDHNGVVSTLPVGKKLPDEFVITRIDTLSVQLEKRNEQKDLRLFNAGGGQPPPAIDKGGVAPANLYTLIGILGGNEKKATFRDYKGAVSILGIGSKLIDGAVITGIDPVSVKLKKGKEASELRVFDIYNSEQSIRKKS